MHALSASFGVACLVASACAFRGHSFSARFLSVFCIASWAVTNVLWTLNSLEQLIALDMLTVLLAAVLPAWRGERVFFHLAMTQLLLDVMYQRFGEVTYFGYMFLYNLAFASELVAIASTGAPDEWIDSITRRWRRDRSN